MTEKKKKQKEYDLLEDKYDILQEPSTPWRKEYFRHKNTIIF